MNDCPLCSGSTVTKISSAGEEIFCLACRNILKSSSLGFEFKLAAGGAESCSVDGLPGWKGPGAEAKCYTFTPGNAEQEKRAQQKANQSAYMEEKRAHTARIVESIAYFTEAPVKIVGDMDYTEEDKPKEERTASNPLDRLVPSTTETEDGVEVNNNQDVGSGITPLASAFHPSFFNTHEDEDDLGMGYCTSCGGNHKAGTPCFQN